MAPAIVGPCLVARRSSPCRNGKQWAICRPDPLVAALREAAAIHLRPTVPDRTGDVLAWGVVCVLVGDREQRGAEPE